MKIVSKKSLGQNFLINPRILDKIIAAGEITKDDIVLEVGPGTGNLTKKLAERAKRVIAVEKDHRLIYQLKEKFSAYGGPAAGWKNTNVEIAEGDILKVDSKQLTVNSGNYKIVGNIPYYITSRFLKTVFEEWPRPKLVVLTIQKEVAQRIMARPPKMNLLAVSVQFFAEPKIIDYVSKENFRPKPKVDSAIIKLTPRPKSYILNSKFFFRIARAGFSQKRKMLIGNLSKKLKLKKDIILEIFEKSKINPKTRAENLDIRDWIMISKNL